MSRIVSGRAPGTAITNYKNSVDSVVRTWGAAELRGRSIRQRALASSRLLTRITEIVCAPTQLSPPRLRVTGQQELRSCGSIEPHRGVWVRTEQRRRTGGVDIFANRCPTDVGLVGARCQNPHFTSVQ